MLQKILRQGLLPLSVNVNHWVMRWVRIPFALAWGVVKKGENNQPPTIVATNGWV